MTLDAGDGVNGTRGCLWNTPPPRLRAENERHSHQANALQRAALTVVNAVDASAVERCCLNWGGPLGLGPGLAGAPVALPLQMQSMTPIAPHPSSFPGWMPMLGAAAHLYASLQASALALPSTAPSTTVAGSATLPSVGQAQPGITSTTLSVSVVTQILAPAGPGSGATAAPAEAANEPARLERPDNPPTGSGEVSVVAGVSRCGRKATRVVLR